MLNANYGLELTEEEVLEIGKKVLQEEKKFNHATGITESHNKLPEFFLEEPLPPTDLIFDLPEEELKGIFDF